MKDAILDAAESRARLAGYNGFSFRDLAEDVGITSASVHYHFPTKEDLAEALTQRYVDRTADYLGDPAALRPRAAVKHLGAMFIRANETEDRMCLCGLLAAESGGLPPPVRPRVAAFFDLLVKWLEVALRPAASAPRAMEIVAAFEGGLLIARVKKDPAILRGIVTEIAKRVEDRGAGLS